LYVHDDGDGESSSVYEWHHLHLRCLLLISGTNSGTGKNVNDNGTSLGARVGNLLGVLLEDDGVRSAVGDNAGQSDHALVDRNNGSLEARDEAHDIALAVFGRGDVDAGTQRRGSWREHGGWESLYGEGRIARRAILDQRSGQRVHLVEVKRCVEHGGESVALLGGRLDPGRVACFNAQNGSGSGEVVLVGDVLGGSQVSRDADTFEKCRGGYKAVGASQAKVVLALLDRLTSKGRGEELDVLAFFATDLHVPLADVVFVSCLLEVIGRGQVAVVEGSLEVLQREGVVENDCVDVLLSRGSSLGRCSRCNSDQGGDKDSSSGDLHYCGDE
jgi:hypothetical protein